jgi:hypothetical protein
MNKLPEKNRNNIPKTMRKQEMQRNLIRRSYRSTGLNHLKEFRMSKFFV